MPFTLIFTKNGLQKKEIDAFVLFISFFIVYL